MYAVAYKQLNADGVVYLPCTSEKVAKSKAKTLFKKGKLNVKVVVLHEDVIFVPSAEECRNC